MWIAASADSARQGSGACRSHEFVIGLVNSRRDGRDLDACAGTERARGFGGPLGGHEAAAASRNQTTAPSTGRTREAGTRPSAVAARACRLVAPVTMKPIAAAALIVGNVTVRR